MVLFIRYRPTCLVFPKNAISGWYCYGNLIHICVNLIHICVNLIHICVYLINIYVNLIHICVNLVHICVNLIHICVYLINICVNLIHICVNLAHIFVNFFKFLGPNPQSESRSSGYRFRKKKILSAIILNRLNEVHK